MQISNAPRYLSPDDPPVDHFTLISSAGAQVSLTNFGGILTAVEVPDRAGNLVNVTLGFAELSRYLAKHPFYGATVGRFCNRIAGGRFALDGQTYQLAVNKHPNHIHGGTVGFDKRVWSVENQGITDGIARVRLALTSPDGEEGYPGTVRVTAEFTWSEDHTLTLSFSATTDRPTIINLTNHAYWNLAGDRSGSIDDHRLQLDCHHYLEVDDTLIPTGRILDVADTPLDFLQPATIGSRLRQLPATRGYDHCLVIDGQPGALRRCARVEEPRSGRTLEVLTTQPGVQFYTGNHLVGEYSPHSGFCLETQHYPDSPNHPHFPSTRLDPGTVFEETTVLRFGVNR